MSMTVQPRASESELDPAAQPFCLETPFIPRVALFWRADGEASLLYWLYPFECAIRFEPWAISRILKLT